MSNYPAQKIPRIIHQTWKSEEIPARWSTMVASVKRHHPDWQYMLWTDDKMDAYVKDKLPEFYSVFASYSRPIMRADVIRYIIMRDFGGLYCDLDYEFLRPYAYTDTELVLATEFALENGDKMNQIANFVFASIPGHPYWSDVLDYLQTNPPKNDGSDDVIFVTGPGMLSKVWFANCEKYKNYTIEPRLVFNPYRIHKSYERKILLNNGITIGVHYGSSTWKDRTNLAYWQGKFKKLFKLK